MTGQDIRASPHVTACTSYQNRKFQMARCRLYQRRSLQQILILQRFSRSTRLAFLRTAPSSKSVVVVFSSNFFRNFVWHILIHASKFAFFVQILARIPRISLKIKMNLKDVLNFRETPRFSGKFLRCCYFCTKKEVVATTSKTESK